MSKFTGSPCRACGATLRYVSGLKCVACCRARDLIRRPPAPPNDHSIESVRSIAAGFSTPSLFLKGCGWAHKAAKRGGFFDDVCSHMVRRMILSDDELIEEARRYPTREAFKRGSKVGSGVIYQRGLSEVAFAHMPLLHRHVSHEHLRSSALKYSRRVDFQNLDKNDYQLARKYGILDDVCSHMPDCARDLWTEERVRREMSTQTSRYGASKFSQPMVRAAKRLGVWGELTEDMPSRGTDNNVIYIWRAVGERFNGEKVYKVGVTSERLGDDRMDHVAGRSGFVSELVTKRTVVKASVVEKKLLRIGSSPGYVGINGGSEFRAMRPAQLREALGVINAA